MKRPLMIIGFSYLLTVAVACMLGPQAAFPLAIALPVAGIALMLLLEDRRFALICVSAGLACMTVWLHTASVYMPATALDGRTVTIEGHVMEMFSNSRGTHGYRVDTVSVGSPGAPQNLSVVLWSVPDLELELTDRIRADVKLVRAGGESGFPFVTQAMASGTYLYAFPSGGIELRPDPSPPLAVYGLRASILLRRNIKALLPGQVGDIGNAILFGDKRPLSAQVTETARVAGVSHVMAVSGLHVTIIAQIVWLLLAFLRLKRIPRAIVTSACVLLFALVVGPSPSILRAVFMYEAYLLAQMLGRERDGLTTLSAAALVFTAFDPYIVLSASFLLSYAATAGIILFGGPIANALHRVGQRATKREGPGFIAQTLATTLSANVMTMPLTILLFDGVSLVSVVTNLLIAPLVPVILFSLLAAGLLLKVPVLSFVARGAGFVAGVAIQIFWGVADLCASIPFAYANTAHGYFKIWIVGAAVIVGVVVFGMKARHLIPHVAVCLVIALLAGMLSYNVTIMPLTRVAALDGTDDASFVVLRGHSAAVIGAGDSPAYAARLATFLRGQGVSRIDLLVLPDLDGRSSAAADLILRQFAVAVVVMPGDGPLRSLVTAQLDGGTHVRTLRSETLALGDRVQLALLVDETGTTAFVRDGESTFACIFGGGDTPPEGRTVVCDAGLVGADAKNADFVRANTLIMCDNKEGAALPAGTVVKNERDIVLLSNGTGRFALSNG